MTLSDAAGNFRNNNFDFIRFIAACSVFVSHAILLGGLKEPVLIQGVVLGGLGVLVFFSVSGFLVARSWERHPRLVAFMGKRILRIFPGLFVCTVFTVFLIGPLFTGMSLFAYLGAPNTMNYFDTLYLVSFSPSYLPGVNFYGSLPFTVNASLWTLKYEMLAYSGLALTAMIWATRRRRGVIVDFGTILICYFFLNLLIHWVPFTFHDFTLFYMVRFSAFFAAGTLFYTYRKVIPYSGWWAILAIISYAMTRFLPTLEPYIGFIAIPYTILYLAFIPTQFIKKFGRYGDFSYGIYIYGWPVEQVVVGMFHGAVGPYKLFAVAFPLVLGLAALSWHLVEKPALKLRRHLSEPRYPIDARLGKSA